MRELRLVLGLSLKTLFDLFINYFVIALLQFY